MNTANLTLEQLILVTAPYNRLFNVLQNEDGSLSAKVTNEYLADLEGGPIGVAETGRHLAILGSMVLAKDANNEVPFYYLACHAKLRRATTKLSESSFLNLKVKTVKREERTATIYGEVFDENNELIFDVDVDYQILSTAAFAQFFGAYKTNEKTNNTVSPYLQRKQLTDIKIEDGRATGLYGVVKAHECEGHFENYPALPVAIVGNNYIELGMKLFQEHTENKFDKIVVTNTTINAFRLAFSGEEVRFMVEIKEVKPDDTIVVTGEAKIADKVISNIEFELKGIKN